VYDPVQKPSAECQAYIITLENALSGIGDLVGASLGSTDPDTIRRRVKDILAEHNTAKTAALKRICEVIGAPVPCVAEDAVEAVKVLLCTSNGHAVRADRAETTLAEIGYALDDAGAQKVYTSGDPGRLIIETERIRLLGDRIENLREQARIAQVTNDYQSITLDKMSAAAVEADKALDALRTPCLADGITMTIAARIRAIPR